MNVLAVTALEKIQAVPLKVWMNLLMGLLLFIAAVIVIKKAAEINKGLLVGIGLVVISSVGLNWIYARNEPAFMTPFVEKVAVFFPTLEKKALKEKQAVVP